MPKNANAPGPIVSSAHLAAGASPGLSEVEYGLILAEPCLPALDGALRGGGRAARIVAGRGADPAPVQHRDRPKRQAEILLALAIEDTHIATYAIRKLAASGLVKTSRAEQGEAGGHHPGRRGALRPAMPRLRERLVAAPVGQGGPGAAEVVGGGGAAQDPVGVLCTRRRGRRRRSRRKEEDGSKDCPSPCQLPVSPQAAPQTRRDG
ncbi:winged helix DNA-binding protein [Dankookia sp. P2]|uniref:winged helix DNA-binding protein n=1 Tax=Dankookia sp. P2 TaxID=3423955 RepID=UPI003D664499